MVTIHLKPLNLKVPLVSKRWIKLRNQGHNFERLTVMSGNLCYTSRRWNSLARTPKFNTTLVGAFNQPTWKKYARQIESFTQGLGWKYNNIWVATG